MDNKGADCVCLTGGGLTVNVLKTCLKGRWEAKSSQTCNENECYYVNRQWKGGIVEGVGPIEEK